MSRGRMITFALSVGLVVLFVDSGFAADETGSHGSGHTSHESTAKPNFNQVFDHVLDVSHWHFVQDWSWHLPNVYIPGLGDRQITKFMILEVIAALLVMIIYIPMARRMRDGRPPRGAWDNAFESMLTFIRDNVAKPTIGEHHADPYVPVLWTFFLFILFSNLLGMIPFGGSPTASIYVTGALALLSFLFVQGSAVAKMGLGHYLKSMWPHIDVPFGLGYVIKPLIFVIEIISVLVRSSVLAVRLFANMFAGHMVLATILFFIVMASNTILFLWVTVTVTSVIGIIALSLLELFFAFLQAFIFTFLTSLFLGMALHPEH